MPEVITSPSNRTIKQIRKLQQKKERQKTGLFYLEGIRLVGDAHQSGAKIEKLLYCPALLDSEFGKNLVQSIQEKNGSEILQVSDQVFLSFAIKENPQGLAAVAEQKWFPMDEILHERGIWTGLFAIQDPGNLGTILRSSDGAGGKGIILLDQTTDPYHPTSVRASMGAVFTQKIIQTSTDDFIRWQKENQYHLVGTDCDKARHYKKYNYPNHMILLMGSEQKGLPESLLQICDERVHIPLMGKMDSLNLSNAASVILFEISYQQNGERSI